MDRNQRKNNSFEDFKALKCLLSPDSSEQRLPLHAHVHREERKVPRPEHGQGKVLEEMDPVQGASAEQVQEEVVQEDGEFVDRGDRGHGGGADKDQEGRQTGDHLALASKHHGQSRRRPDSLDSRTGKKY